MKPDDVEYSYYSSTCRSYSRIDYFLISAALRSKIEDVFYDGIVIPDHAQIYATSAITPKGTLFHCLWDCNKIKDFWKEVAQMIFQIVSVKLPLHPNIFILGLYPSDPNFKNEIKVLTDMCLLQANG